MNDSVTINGIELTEGDTLWRLAGVTVFDSFENQNPDDVLHETARQLSEYDEVDGSVEEIKTNLKEEPGYYDDTDLMKYQAMEVVSVRPERGSAPAEIKIQDLKERSDFIFTPTSNHPDSAKYSNWEPLTALEMHLGTTLLPVES